MTYVAGGVLAGRTQTGMDFWVGRRPAVMRHYLRKRRGWHDQLIGHRVTPSKTRRPWRRRCEIILVPGTPFLRAPACFLDLLQQLAAAPDRAVAGINKERTVPYFFAGKRCIPSRHLLVLEPDRDGEKD